MSKIHNPVIVLIVHFAELSIGPGGLATSSLLYNLLQVRCCYGTHKETLLSVSHPSLYGGP